MFGFKNKNKRNGFTVLELMVVIGIMVMMLVLTVPNFKSFDRSQILESEADKLFSILRQAQVWALTGQTVGATRYNFGVHFLQCVSAPGCQYTFFKDDFTSGDKRYSTGEEYGIGQITLGSGVYVAAINPQSSNILDIIFEVPTGKVYLNGAEAGSGNATITLTSSFSGRSRTITVNSESGQINIQ
ncbi:MAG: prepilin-type N-terminal cleavage/methylation domain-containing protein [Patescibacteria group bacterium]|nr:prepilin-type N-terminal cleavage/methylation domain-containing protein [Patescibacteria group bacterium]